LVSLHFRKGLLTVAFLLLLPFPKTSYAMEWDDLWTTTDQQAQQAFSTNDYQQAADKFDDPQWKAAAQYKAGQYEEAASALESDSSATGLYNLGNALAQSGKLPEAVEAYKQSLKQDPANEDAKYNQAQVEKALEEQKKQQQEGDGDDKDKDSKDKDSDQDDKEGDQKKEGDSEQDGEKKPSDGEQSENDAKKEESESKEKAEEEAESKESDQAKEEQQDAEEKEDEAKAQPEKSSEYNESDQANEQWLNRIPDDPAGLLKRKFKYQYGQRNR
jgi:Ca-activated chloride channel family protein